MGKKNEIKVRFNITLKSAFNLGSESDGKSFTIAWKRGSKSKNRGQTKKVDAKGGLVSFGETVTIVATMAQDEKSKKFDTKKLELTVKEEDSKKPREVGKVTIELGEYASAGHHGPVTLALDGDKKSSKKASKDSSSRGGPSIKFDVDSEWTHFNKKKITDKKKEGKDGVEIDGVEYGLETDASDMSDDDATTLGDMSESESEMESEDEDESEDEGMKEMSGSAVPVSPRNKAASSSSSSEVDLKGSKKAQKEEKAKDKQIAKLEKELSKLKDELGQAKDSVRDKAMKATGSQQELKQLKKELAEAKKGKGGGGGDDSELRKELDDAKKTIKDLQDDLRKKDSELKLSSSSFRELKESRSKEGKDAETLRKELQDKEAELKEKNRLFLQLKDDFDALKKATDGASKKGDDSDKLRKEVESLRRELESAQKEAEGLKKEIANANELLRTKERAAAEQAEQLRAREQEAREARDLLQQRERELATAAAVAEGAKGDGDKHVQQLQQLLAERDRLLAEREKEVTRVRQDADAAAERARRLDTEAADLRSQLKQKADDNERLTALLSEQQQKNSAGGASGGANDELEEELESTKKKLKKAQKEVEDKEKRITELQLLVSKAGGVSNGGGSSSSSSGGESVESLKSQLDKQKAEVKALTKENREAREKFESLQQELDRVKSKAGSGGASSSSSGGGDSKELDNLRKKIKSFEQEKEEDELIEREIYCMTSKYREGVHVSAQNMCKMLSQWGVLNDPPNERLLSKILDAIKKGYKVVTDDNAALIKWLSFTTNLHEQLELDVGTSEDENSGNIPENGIYIFRDSTKANEDDDDPVSIFFHNLETIIFEIYSAFLKNIYAHIDDVIVPAILQPIAGRDRRGPSHPRDRGSKMSSGKNKSNALPSSGLTTILGEHLEMLHKYNLFDSIIKQFFCQVFYYINTRLFNNLLRQEELCSCGSGFQIKLGLSQLEEWISKADKNDKKHLSQAAKRYLLHITEAANVLVVDKDIFTDEEMIENVFPTLTIPQIKYLLEHFQTDQYAPNPVPRNVMATLDGLARQRKGQKTLEVDEAYLLSFPKK